MNLRKFLSIGIIVPLTTALVLFNSQKAEAGCGWLDPTCDSGPNDCLFGACPGSGGGGSDSSVGGDMTPPQVRTARDLISQGYSCVDINEYSAFTCNTPGGMDPSTFSYRSEAFWGNYLGGNRGWAWDCLNSGGQLWGTSNGSLLCQSGMR